MPIVAQAVWIVDALKDAPGGAAEMPNNDHEQQRMAEWLSEDGCERAARRRDASAFLGCDLEGQCADDHVASQESVATGNQLNSSGD